MIAGRYGRDMRTAPLHHTVIAGRYLVLDQIGAGGMGSVWRARDERSGEVVAVKVLGQHSAALLIRFVREQAVRVRHPHVVAPISWAADDDLVVLAMDLVGGGSVQDLLDEHGPLPVGYAAVLLEQLLQALAAVHAAGLVHRDVKPANLLLEPTGERRGPTCASGTSGSPAPIGDARFTTVPGAIGTEGYMAPEQARGGAAPDPAPGPVRRRVGSACQLITGLPRSGPGAGSVTGPLVRCWSGCWGDRPRERLRLGATRALDWLRRLEGRRRAPRRARPPAAATRWPGSTGCLGPGRGLPRASVRSAAVRAVVVGVLL